ncbi:MAG: FkbM family methyltransferase [Nocardioides sp.]
MALSPGEVPDSVSGDLAGYRFWTAFTAAQAVNAGRPVEAVGKRVRRFFHDVCRLVEPGLCLELGAHEGSFSRWARRNLPQATCLALEANPYVHAKFRERLSESGVDYRNLAATTSSGPVTLTIPTQIGEQAKGRANRMGSLAVHRSDRAHETVEVEGVRVDELDEVSSAGPTVAWIDVEGASEQVLEGARGIMARADAVYIEVEIEEMWPGQWLELDVARYFLELGLVPVMRDLQRPHQHNVVFASAALATRPDVAELAAAVYRPVRQPKESQGVAEPG